MTNQQLKAKLITCNVATKNSATSRKFYSTLFGGDDFARTLNDKYESYYRPIQQDGLTMTIAARWDPRESITCYFAVDNLTETVHELVAAGGKVVMNPSPMPISGPPAAKKVYEDALRSRGEQPTDSAGQFVTMLDPDGNYIGLMQLETPIQHHFNAEPGQRKLSQQQVSDHDNWRQHGEPLLK